ncbi:MAG TPA: arylmalonate decarboxylase [Actinobacteria bacterium]|nr:arylmalonate decarboxylase [Actinomycetota bacterium]
MPDITGWRAKVAVIVPSTNTVVEHDMAQWRPPGVTFHAGRMHITNPNLSNDAEFEGLIEQLDATIEAAVERVLTCQPDYMLMGMSAGTFWGGLEGSKAFTAKVAAWSGLPVSTGSTSTAAALTAFGVRRIAVFSPYQPVADHQVRAFFEEAGFDVLACTGLRCETATAIAEVTPERIGRMVAEIDSPDVEAIVQVGTNLSFVRQAEGLEGYLGKPVIPINMAVLWHAMRAMGITDRLEGCSRLLREF